MAIAGGNVKIGLAEAIKGHIIGDLLELEASTLPNN